MGVSETDKKRLLANLEIAKKYHEEEFWNRARRMIDLYEGKHWEDVRRLEDRITINFVRLVVDIKVSSIAYRPPQFNVYPRGEHSEPRLIAADLWRNILPYLWREVSVHPETKRGLRDSYVVGLGALKTGYRFQTKERIDESGKRERGPIQYDNVFAERVNMKNLILDPEMDAPDWKKARFVAHKLVLPFENAVRMGFDPKKMETVRVDSRYSSAVSEKEHLERYVVWEFHDLVGDQLFYISGEDGLEPKKRPYSLEGPPFVLFSGKDMWDNPYGMSQSELIEDINREVNLIHSRLSTRARRFLDKYVGPQGGLTEKGETALASDREGAYVETTSENVKIDILKHPAFAQELVQYASMLQDLLTQVTSVNEYMRGILPSGRKTAFEVQTLQQQSGAIAQNELAIYESACTQIARNFVQLGKQFFDDERTVRFAGAEESQPQVKKYTKEEIQGEFDIEVEMGTTRFENTEMERFLLLQLYQMVGQDPQVNKEELLRRLFEKFNLKTAELLQPPPMMDPQQMQPEPSALMPGGSSLEEDPMALLSQLGLSPQGGF